VVSLRNGGSGFTFVFPLFTFQFSLMEVQKVSLEARVGLDKGIHYHPSSLFS
jgi:hypothetical protein